MKQRTCIAARNSARPSHCYSMAGKRFGFDRQ